MPLTPDKKRQKALFSADWRRRNKERVKESNANWYATNRSVVKENNARYYAENRDVIIAKALTRERASRYTVGYIATRLRAQATQRARHRNLKCSITRDWVIERLDAGVCEATGLKFDYAKQGGRSAPRAPSLDRIDSAGGYTPDNTRVVVFQYNAAKNAWPDGTLVEMCKALLRRKAPRKTKRARVLH